MPNRFFSVRLNAGALVGSGFFAMKMKTLAQVNPKADYSFDPADVALCPPDILGKVTQCISIWSLIEAFTAKVAIYALKGDVRVSMEMFLSITSSGAANAALKTAVRVGLEPKYAEIFNAIWTINGQLADERHRLAHWGMGYSKDIPNAILLLNAKDGLKRGAHNISVGRLEQYGKFTPRPINKVRVCSSEYLDYLIGAFDAQLNRISGFVGLLERAEDLPHPSRRTMKQLYDRLYNEPQILQAITLMRGHQRKKRATPKRRPRLKPLGQKLG